MKKTNEVVLDRFTKHKAGWWFRDKNNWMLSYGPYPTRQSAVEQSGLKDWESDERKHTLEAVKEAVGGYGRNNKYVK